MGSKIWGPKKVIRIGLRKHVKNGSISIRVKGVQAGTPSKAGRAPDVVVG